MSNTEERARHYLNAQIRALFQWSSAHCTGMCIPADDSERMKQKKFFKNYINMNWPIEKITAHFNGKKVTFSTLGSDLTQSATIKSLKSASSEGLIFETEGDTTELIVVTRGTDILTYRKVPGEEIRHLTPLVTMKESGKGVVQEIIEIVRQSLSLVELS